MARAEETVVTRTWHLECLCENCELRQGGNYEPDFLQLNDFRLDERGRAITPAIISGPDRRKQAINISGFPKREDIGPAFEQCEGPEIFEDKLVCGAIANLNRGKKNGREEI